MAGPAWGHANGQEREGSAGGCWLNWNKARRPPRSPCPGDSDPAGRRGEPRQAVPDAPQLLGQSPGGAERDGSYHGAGGRPQVGAGDHHATLQLGKSNFLEQDFRLIPL